MFKIGSVIQEKMSDDDARAGSSGRSNFWTKNTQRKSFHDATRQLEKRLIEDQETERRKKESTLLPAPHCAQPEAAKKQMDFCPGCGERTETPCMPPKPKM